MLAEVASPAIPPGLRLKTKQEEIQARVQNRERKSANVRERQVPPVFGLVCVLLNPSLPFLPPISAYSSGGLYSPTDDVHGGDGSCSRRWLHHDLP